MTDCNVLIVGQGMAGSTLAWQLHWRGVSFAIVDRHEAISSSKIAAGLITPITGKRFARSWRIDEFLPVAVDFYSRVAADIGCEELFVRTPIVRLFQNTEEREQFLGKAHTFGSLARWPVELDSNTFRNEHGGFDMPSAGYLRVERYQEFTRQFFANRFHIGRVLADDLVFTTEAIEVPSLDLRCNRVVFCEGVAGMQNPHLGQLKFTPAKGEILTLRIPDLHEARIINRGVWLMPAGGQLYRSGSTYDREHCDTIPTEAGRTEILNRLQEFLRFPFEVLDHVAAVRPIGDDRLPFVGFLPHSPRLGYLNGLASKGTLLAPFFASELAKQIAGFREG
jgi:glycine oxidase